MFAVHIALQRRPFVSFVIQQFLRVVDAAYEQAAIEVCRFEDERVGQVAKAREQVIDAHRQRHHLQVRVGRLLEALALPGLVERVFHVPMQVRQRRQRSAQPGRDRNIPLTEVQHASEAVLVQEPPGQIDQFCGEAFGKIVMGRWRNLCCIGDFAGCTAVGDEQRCDALGN
ncbi:hypothetical protein D3C78_989760 [compost metagenome]